MTEKPKALRLADVLDRSVLAACHDAATELRRLHAENETLTLRAVQLAEQLNKNNPLLDEAANELDRLYAEVEALRSTLAQREAQQGEKE